jgi:hypothetical protein
MEWFVAFFLDQGMPHQEAIEEDGRCTESCLGELQHDADLRDEVGAFAAQLSLFFRRHPIEN